MPLYVYVCEECGYEDEILENFVDKNVHTNTKKCPKCNQLSFVRQTVPKNISFQLKGKGWFKDGY